MVPRTDAISVPEWLSFDSLSRELPDPYVAGGIP